MASELSNFYFLETNRLHCLVLSRVAKDGFKEWLIANGTYMGRWSINFGVHCLADTADCKGFLKNIHKGTPGTTIEEYCLEPFNP